ncbi:MAG TPA: hypothetical protein VMG59_00350 [Phycisphaerae bacterium]|nr:hypothetical protein [Phycisphaerae bacterium]
MTFKQKMAMCIALAAVTLPVPALWADTAAANSSSTSAATTTTTSNTAVQAEMQAMAQQLAALKKDQAASQATEASLEQQIAVLKTQNATTAESQATAQATAEAQAKAIDSIYKEVMSNSETISADLAEHPTDNNISETFQNMFTPPTGINYFSPFENQNPSHIRPDMNMQIGQLGDMRFYIGVQTVGRYQALTQQAAYHTPPMPAVEYPGLDPGFQTAYGNLDFLATIPGKLDVFFDLYLSSVGHPSTTYGDQGYLIIKQLPPPFAGGPIGDIFNYINLKAGAFDIDFGDQNFHRSNNAFVELNPLIGNAVVDPSAEQIGFELYSVKGPIYWLAGFSNGTTTGYFDYGSNPAVHGKVWGYIGNDLRLSASVYYCDLGGTANAEDLATDNQITDLYASTRSGEPYNGIFNAGDDGGQITPEAGLDVQAYQGDITWNHWPWEMYGNVGWTQDSAYDERWLYGQAMATYHITAPLYVAAQYSFAYAGAVHGVDTNGWVGRVQVGGGYWLTKSILTKVEYVYQQYYNFAPDTGMVSGVVASDNPRFSGVTAEIAFGF